MTSPAHIAARRTARLSAAAALPLLWAGCAAGPSVSVAGPTVDSLEADSTVTSIDFSDDSRFFAHLCQNGTLYVRDVMRETSAGKRALGAEVRSVDLGAGGVFAVAGPAGIEIWSSATDRRSVLAAPAKPIRFVLFDPGAERLAAATVDGTVTVWDVRSGEVTKSFVPQSVDGDVQLLPGAGFGVLYVMGSDRVRVLGLAPGEPDVMLRFPRDPRVQVSLSRDGRSLASVSTKGTIEVRRLPDGNVVAQLEGFATPPATLALSPDGSVLAVDVGGNALELWDVFKGERLDRFDATVGLECGISFSPDGYLVAWVERDRKKVRFWSPTRGAVLWQPDGSLLIEKARPVCSDLAATIRFRLATEPFERGMGHLERDELVEAIRAFDAARNVFAAYPGLAVAADEARGRHRAKLRAAEVAAELEQLELAGDYYKAISLLDTFLRDHGRYGDHGYRERVGRIRAMLQHFEAAEAHRAAGRELDAVVDFEQAVAIVPALADRHPEYAALRQGLLDRLSKRADGAFGSEGHEELLQVYADLRRLRPLEPLDWLRSGIAHEGLGQRQRAIEAYRLVPKSAPEFVRSRQNLARIARAAGQLEQARADLEEAREVAPTEVSLERDFAEICELLRDFDAAIASWRRVAEIDQANPAPFETLGRLEQQRGRWREAAEAYRKAVRRASEPRPDLLAKIAEAHQQLGEREKVLEAYVDLLEVADGGAAVPWLGERPRHKVLTWIRELGYVRHRRAWIPRDQFLAEQGWVRHGGGWLRPEEAQLREIAEQFEARANAGLRNLPDERYRAEAEDRGILKGMNRREIVRAWGFFQDQNVLELDAGEVVYEQLLYANGRQVYLRNGLVCFWAE